MRWLGVAAAACLLTLMTVPGLGAGVSFHTIWQVRSPDSVESSPTLWTYHGERGVVVTCTDGSVTLYRSDGTVRWRYHLGASDILGAAAVADIDGDDAPETVICSRTGRLACVDAQGKLRWERQLPGFCGWCTPLVADPAGNGKLQTVCPDEQGNVSSFDAAGRLLWRYKAPKGISSPLAAFDLDGDGRQEVLVPASNGDLIALRNGGCPLWVYRHGGDVYSAPTVADLNGDGRVEVVQGFGDGALVCVDGATGRPRWAAKVGAGLDSTVSAADLNGDGKLAVVAGEKEYGFSGFDCAGHLLWRWLPAERRPEGQYPSSAAAVADINGDSVPEVIGANRDGVVVAINRTGKETGRFAVPQGCNSTPLVSDLNGDGKLEIIVTGRTDIVCVTAGGGGRVQWSSYRNGPTLASVAGTPKVRKPARTVAQQASPALRASLSGVSGAFGLATSAPAPAAGLFWLQVSTPRGAAYATADLVGKGKTLKLLYDGSHAGAYTVSMGLLTNRRRLVNSTTIRRRPFQEHLRLAHGAYQAFVAQLPRVPDRMRSGLTAKRAALHGIFALARDGIASSEQVISLTSAPERLTKIAKVAANQRADFPALVWQANPWHPFMHTETPAGKADGTIVLPPLYQNERRPIAVNILNLADRTLGVRVVPDDLTVGKETLPWQGKLEMLTLRSVGTRREVAAWDALPQLGPDRIIEIPSLEARQLWLILDTAGLAPGRYHFPVTLATTEQNHRERRLALDFEVMPVNLKEGRQLAFCQWAYFFTPGSYLYRYQEQTVADLVKHGTNVFVLDGSACPTAYCDAEGNLAKPMDWTECDRLLKVIDPRGKVLLYTGGVSGPAMFTPAWEKAMATWVRETVAHLASLGVGREGFAFYPMDEPGLTPGSADVYIRIAKAIKAADPQVQVYTDPVTGMTLDKLRAAAPYTDIWCPNDGVVKQEQARMEFLLSTGKPVWTYRCDDNAKNKSMTTYYRGAAWQAWRQRLTGIGFWTYCTTQYEPWRGDEYKEAEFVLVYPGDGPVSSRRWEAVAFGLQDYAAMDLFARAMREAQGRVEPALLAQAKAALDKTMQSIHEYGPQDDEGKAMDEGRTMAARWTLKLRQAMGR